MALANSSPNLVTVFVQMGGVGCDPLACSFSAAKRIQVCSSSIFISRVPKRQYKFSFCVAGTEHIIASKNTGLSFPENVPEV